MPKEREWKYKIKEFN